MVQSLHYVPQQPRETVANVLFRENTINNKFNNKKQHIYCLSLGLSGQSADSSTVPGSNPGTSRILCW